MYLAKNIIQKDTCTAMVLVVVLIISKTWKQSKCSLREEWLKKWYVVKELINAIWSNMDGSRDYSFKWSESEKDEYDITHMCNLKKKDRKELIYKTETDSHILKTNLGWLSKGKVGKWIN